MCHGGRAGQEGKKNRVCEVVNGELRGPVASNGSRKSIVMVVSEEDGSETELSQC